MSDKPEHSMPAPSTPNQSESMLSQFKSLSPVFWVAGWMELIERFSYYGVRVVLPVFRLMPPGGLFRSLCAKPALKVGS